MEQPLRKKYMEKITEPRLKGEIMSFLADNDAAKVVLLNRQNKLNLQWDIDKRARKHMKNIRKWNNLIVNDTVEEELERNNFKDIGIIFDLFRKGFINLFSVNNLRIYLYQQLERTVINENTESLNNILKNKDKIWYNSDNNLDVQWLIESLLRHLADGKSNNLEMSKILLEHGAKSAK